MDAANRCCHHDPQWGTDVPELNGNWTHNSYNVNPADEKLDDAPGPSTSIACLKWAKGVLHVQDAKAGAAELEFATGVSLAVNFTLQAQADGLAFAAQGVGKTGPLVGVEYRLAGWAIVDSAGEVTSIAGGIQALRGGSDGKIGLGGQPVGTIGHFRLSR